MSLAFFLLFCRVGCEENQADCTREYKDISDIKNKGIVYTTAGHIEKINDEAVKQTVQHIGQRTANQQSGTTICPNAHGRAARPDGYSQTDDDGNANEDPATSLRSAIKQTEIDTSVFSVAKIDERRQNVYRAYAFKIHEMDHHILADLIYQKGGDCSPCERAHFLIPV
mgnify:CR=1 FL=1